MAKIIILKRRKGNLHIVADKESKSFLRRATVIGSRARALLKKGFSFLSPKQKKILLRKWGKRK